MAKKVITKAETLAEKTERLMQVYFNAQQVANEAKEELNAHIEEHKEKIFAKSNKYIVRYGEIVRTTSQDIEFEKKVSFSPQAVMDMYADALTSKFMKIEINKTAFAGLIDKSKIVETLNLGEDKKAIKNLRNYGILGVSSKESISIKKIEFASDEE